MDALTITTNKGQVLEAGGDGGDEFDLEIPEGASVGAMKGSFGNYLHNFSVKLGQTPHVWSNDPGSDSDSD